MKRLVRDVHRLLSVPAPWILLALEIVFAVGVSVSMKLLDMSPSPALALGFLPAITALFGAVSAGADFRFGSVVGEILALGGQVAYLARTFAAIGVTGAAAGTIGGAAASLAWLSLADQPPTAGRLVALVLGAALAGASWAILGAVLAVATKGQIAAVATVLAYLMFVEPILEVSAGSAAAFLPGHAAVELFSLGGVGAVGAGGFRLLGIVVLVAAVAGAFVRRREVAVVMA